MLTHLQRARHNVDAIRAALQSPSPEDVNAALPQLEEAVESLQQLVRELQQNQDTPTAPGDNHHEFTLQLHALNTSLDVAQRLVVHGQTFCDGWARILGSATAGYQPSGDAAPLTAPATVSIKG
jgi:Zn-dependent oligopeptidase